MCALIGYFLVLAFMCMNMNAWSCVVLNVFMFKKYSHICIYTHMNDDLVNRGDLKGVLKCILN